MKIAAVILTYNEEIHIERCIASISSLVDEILVVDSFSTDATCEIACNLGALVLKRSWKNYADQFNWSIEQLGSDVQWVLRIDADEFFTEELSLEFSQKLPFLPGDIEGVYIPRRMIFMGRVINHGGVFPVYVARLFRLGKGRCEQRWMDEHIKVSGATLKFKGELIDHNLNSLSWWIEKHNSYASREVIDLLNLEYGFLPYDSVANLTDARQASTKRWIKEKIYSRLPRGLRALVYFMYRYFLRLGFLDGVSGSAFHFLQGFWYRYLVDLKMLEVKGYMQSNCCSPEVAIHQVLEIDLGADVPPAVDD